MLRRRGKLPYSVLVFDQQSRIDFLNQFSQKKQRRNSEKSQNKTRKTKELRTLKNKFKQEVEKRYKQTVDSIRANDPLGVISPIPNIKRSTSKQTFLKQSNILYMDSDFYTNQGHVKITTYSVEGFLNSHLTLQENSQIHLVPS